MSGPIVRKYGFPNFEKIFGDRGLQHGVDEDSADAAPAQPADAPAAKDAPKKAVKTKAKAKKGSK